MMWMLILLSLLTSNPGKDSCNSSYTPCRYEIRYQEPTSHAIPTIRYPYKRVRIYITPSLFIDSFYTLAREEPVRNSDKKVIPLQRNEVVVSPDQGMRWALPHYSVYVRKGASTYQLEHDSIVADLDELYRSYDSTLTPINRVYSMAHHTDFYKITSQVRQDYYVDSTYSLMYKYTPVPDMLYFPNLIRHYKVDIATPFHFLQRLYAPSSLNSVVSSLDSRNFRGSYLEVYHYIHGPYTYQGWRNPSLPVYLGTIDSTGDCHCVWESFRRGK